MFEGGGNIPESSGGLPKIQSSFENPIPFRDIVKSINSLIKAFYNGVSYRFPIFTYGTIVEVDKGSSSYHYFGLADSGHYLPAKMKNEGYNFQKLQEGFPVVAKGYFNLEPPLNKPYMFEIRLNVVELYHVGLDKPSTVPNDFKKPAPETIKRVGLITSSNSEAIDDFYKGLKKARYELQIKIHTVNLLNPESIAAGIKAADAAGHDVLVIARGGGSDMYLFNDPRIVAAIKDCKTYTITGLGHANNRTDCDKVSDLSVETPTSAGVHIKTEIGRKYFADKNMAAQSPIENQNPKKPGNSLKRYFANCVRTFFASLKRTFGTLFGYFLGLMGLIVGFLLFLALCGLALMVLSVVVRGCMHRLH